MWGQPGCASKQADELERGELYCARNVPQSNIVGLPSPLILGLLAMLLNYLPYVGPACMAVILFAVGFVTFPSLGQAFIAPASLIVLTTLEGHLITPTVLGRSLTLDPLAVFDALGWPSPTQ